MRPDDLTGKRFARLTGIRRVANWGKQTVWLWRCDCSLEKEIAADKVKSGHTRSCGCLVADVNRKHGHAYQRGRPSRTYRAWANMLSRVKGYTESHRKNYVERDIAVCERWMTSFEAFLDDMGECPKNLTLDRINNDGCYEPTNCRWTTPVVQTVNRRVTHMVTVDGENLCLSHACAKLNVLYDTAMKRLKRGFTPYEALYGR